MRKFALIVVWFAMLDCVTGAVEYAPSVTVYAGGFANGTIHFKPQCTELVKQYLDVFTERPLSDGHYQAIAAQIDKCNRSYN